MIRFLCLLVAVPLLLTACESGDAGPQPDPDPEAPTLSREAFISAYVDLRMAALRSPDTELTPAERERILEAHGVTSDELLDFVEVHSRNEPRVMQEIWAEIQDRIREAREEAGASEIFGGDDGDDEDGDEEEDREGDGGGAGG